MIKRWLSLFLKGMAMGAADVVPGVSGGTVAFITGIYEELLESIAKVNVANLKLLFSQGPKAFWQAINGNFFLVLIAGIASSFVLFSSLILHVIAVYPLLVWGFFFGLVIASAIYLFKTLTTHNWKTLLALVLGVMVAYLTTLHVNLALSPTPINFFVGGAIAICAMILPGISGSYLLLLMGLYLPVLTAIKSFDISLVGLFLLGAGLGILLFSRVLNWLLHRFHEITLATLVGFLIGSLNVIWPWKEVISWRESSSGAMKPLIQENILPMQYTQITGNDPQILGVAVACLVGLSLIFVLEKTLSRKE
ncbi:MAG: DUF368 domain-containing protein [Cellvibrionales bacterium]|nr:DUF368 domain-containing protein [Cellvibrionales bacterium]